MKKHFLFHFHAKNLLFSPLSRDGITPIYKTEKSGLYCQKSEKIFFYFFEKSEKTRQFFLAFSVLYI